MRAIQIGRQEPGNKTGAAFGRQPAVGPEACRMQVCVRVCVCVCVFCLAVEKDFAATMSCAWPTLYLMI